MSRERTKPNRERIPEIAIAAILSNSASRQRLAGIFDYLGTVHRWNLHVLRDQDEIEAFFANGDATPAVDGVLYSGIYDEATFARLKALQCPVVMMENDAGDQLVPTERWVVMRSDADKIAKAAVNAFAGFGRYRSFAFVESLEPQEWSGRRGAAFRKAVAAAGLGDVATLPSPGTDIHERRRLLAQFLKSLDYPAAILAANDINAMSVIEVAKAVGISVPGKISVLGIDNDPYVCDSVTPAISSVEPDFHWEGRTAAETLDRMLRSRKLAKAARSGPILSGVRRVVLRESTPHLPPAENVVARAKEFVAKHATEGIAPADVAARLGVSRSLLDLRFRETQKTTVGRLITDTKLAEAERMLVQTSHSIGAIHALCGFRSANALKNLFKARHGMSMRAWRARRHG